MKKFTLKTYTLEEKYPEDTTDIIFLDTVGILHAGWIEGGGLIRCELHQEYFEEKNIVWWAYLGIEDKT